MITNRNNKFFCVIGIGDHSYFKIIPALLQSGKKIVGIVSRSNNFRIRKFRRFRKIELALKILPKQTTFLISTPPSTHFYYIKILLSSKRDFIVEKPMFTKPKQVIACKKYFLSDRKIIFREAFMYRYSLMYKKVKNFVEKNLYQINSINCNFLVPNYTQNTFRDNSDSESSPLYDIGCYIFDFFVNLNKSLQDFNINNVKYLNNKIVNIRFSFSIDNKLVYCEIGLSDYYSNNIIFNMLSGYNFEYSPFFYGRPKMKIIKNNVNNINYTFHDKNAFVQMFKVNRKMIKKYKKNNYYSILKVNEILFNLNSKIKNKLYDS